MTLLEEVQRVMERTYAPAGVDLAHCIIGRQRTADLMAAAGWAAEDCPEDACTFLRQEGGVLRVAIFYSDRLIAALERENPRECISHRNIGFLIAFLEEITHAVHAAIAFRHGFRAIESEGFACALEAQAKVDSYWLVRRFCRCLLGGKGGAEVRDWIADRIFEDARFDYAKPRLARRYRLAHQIARAFVDQAEELEPGKRLVVIREFRAKSLLGKARWLRRGRVRAKRRD